MNSWKCENGISTDAPPWSWSWNKIGSKVRMMSHWAFPEKGSSISNNPSLGITKLKKENKKEGVNWFDFGSLSHSRMVRLNAVILKAQAWRGQAGFRAIYRSQCQDNVNHVEIYFNRAETKEEIVGIYPVVDRKEGFLASCFEILIGLELIKR